MDIALTLDSLVPQAQYQGSVTDNTEVAFDNILWLDERPKPTWGDIEDAWVNLEPTLNPIEQLTTAIKNLPVAKRVDPTFSLLISQSLLALEHNDMEALSYLITNFTTEDQNYIAIIDQAILLFNVEAVP